MLLQAPFPNLCWIFCFELCTPYRLNSRPTQRFPQISKPLQHTLVSLSSSKRNHFCVLFSSSSSVVDGFSCTSADFSKSYSFIFVCTTVNSLLSSASSIRHSKYYNATLSTLGARCSSTAQHNRVDDNTISTQNNSKELPLSAFYAYALLLVGCWHKRGLMLHNPPDLEHWWEHNKHERLFSSAHCCKISSLYYCCWSSWLFVISILLTMHKTNDQQRTCYLVGNLWFSLFFSLPSNEIGNRTTRSFPHAWYVEMVLREQLRDNNLLGNEQHTELLDIHTL